MGAAQRKTLLFENIVRLRRVSRALPNDHDVFAVRSALEEELGATVSRRLAASLLGVSHTALRRWIAAGDLPVVESVAGRYEIPVAAVLDLHDAVARERMSGRRSRHLLELAMAEGRERADRIIGSELVTADAGDGDPHRRTELRSLAYHRALAKRLRRPMIDDARHLLWKWREQGKIDARHADHWEGVLGRPVADIRNVIGEDTEFGRDLRQNSPFAGMLSEPERRKIMREVG